MATALNSWVRSRSELMSPKTKRSAFLESFVHGSLAPGGIENMDWTKIKTIFGSHTLGRYLADIKHRHHPAFRADLEPVLPTLSRIGDIWHQLLRRCIGLDLLSQRDDKPFGDTRIDLRSELKTLTHAIRQGKISYDDYDIVKARAALAQAKVLADGIGHTLNPLNDATKSLFKTIKIIQKIVGQNPA